MEQQEGRKKAIRIRIEDTEDGEVQEFETQSTVLYLAEDYVGDTEEESGVNVTIVRNLKDLPSNKGVERAAAIARKLETETQTIVDLIKLKLLKRDLTQKIYGQEDDGDDE